MDHTTIKIIIKNIKIKNHKNIQPKLGVSDKKNKKI